MIRLELVPLGRRSEQSFEVQARDGLERFEVVEPGVVHDRQDASPPVETAQGRIDLIMDVFAEKVAPANDPAEEYFYKAYTISYWSMDQAEAKTWLDAQFGG